MTETQNDYHRRELQKTEGWKRLADTSASVEERARGLLLVIHAHFDRSADAWEPHRGHPNFEEYTRHWLVANGARLAPAEIVGYLEQRYPAPRPKDQRIPPGASYWTTLAKYRDHIRRGASGP